MTDRRYLQMEYIWVSGRFSRGDRRPDMVAEQALDMGVHIVCSRVYISDRSPFLADHACLNFQVRYFGLFSVA